VPPIPSCASTFTAVLGVHVWYLGKDTANLPDIQSRQTAFSREIQRPSLRRRGFARLLNSSFVAVSMFLEGDVIRTQVNSRAETVDEIG
jgi:hypothetical protein